MKFDRWQKTDCEVCRIEFEVTRTEPKEIKGIIACSDCKLYEKAYNEGYQAGLENSK